jgi:hypothetical protein
VPGGFSAAGGVVETADFRQDIAQRPGCSGLLSTADDLKGHLGKVAAPGGCAVLVAYDA